MTNDSTKRVFIGIPVSREISRVIPMLKTTLESDPSDSKIRWVAGTNLHLTLSFLGNVSKERINEIIKILEETIDAKKFGASLTGTGLFPNKERPRVFWLGMEEGADELTRLQQQVDDAVSKFKDSEDKKSFKPHITIGRVAKGVKTWKFDVESYLNTVYSPIRFDVNSVYLYESNLRPEGVRYTTLATFPLQ